MSSQIIEENCENLVVNFFLVKYVFSLLTFSEFWN